MVPSATGRQKKGGKTKVKKSTAIKNQTYYKRNQSKCQEKARERMRRYRARKKLEEWMNAPGADDEDSSESEGEGETFAEIDETDTEEDHRTELGPAATHSPYPPGVIVADGISEVPQAFIEAKQAHETWMAEWGELDNWPRMFDSLFQMACADNRIRKWAKDLRTTRDIMEKILTSLQDSMPPYNPMAWDQLRSLFVTYSDLHRTIVRAQTIVEVHLYEVESVQRTSY